MKKWMTCLALGLLVLSVLGCQAGEKPASNATEVTTPDKEEEKPSAPQEVPAESRCQLKEITQIDGSMYFYVLPLDQVLEGQELEEYNAMAKQMPDILFNFRVEN